MLTDAIVLVDIACGLIVLRLVWRGLSRALLRQDLMRKLNEYEARSVAQNSGRPS